MSRWINYEEGQILGPYGIKYLEEAEPDKDKNRPEKRIRKALFECGHCGKEFTARISNVKNGHTKSCGCWSRESSIKTIKEWNSRGEPPWNKKIYRSGDTVGSYGVIFLEECDSPKRWRIAKFVCPICGMTFEAIIENVSRGLNKGCGNHSSHGEKKLAQIFKKLSVKFEIQKSFEDLLSPRDWKYRFDFYLPDYDLLIEYDGVQHFHYRENTNSWNNKENFFDTVRRDSDKDNYCIKNQKPLIRIPYTEFQKITEENVQKMLEGSPDCEILFNKVY